MPVDIDCSRSGARSKVTVWVGVIEDGWYNDSGVSESFFDSRHIHLQYVSKFQCHKEHIKASTRFSVDEMQK
jgi:hypothetical protein